MFVKVCVCTLYERSLDISHLSYQSHWFSNQPRGLILLNQTPVGSPVYGSNSPLLRGHLSLCNPLPHLCALLSIRLHLSAPTFSIFMGLPWRSGAEESACNAGDPASIPGSGRFPGEGNGNPFQHSCLEDSMDRGAWQATVHRVHIDILSHIDLSHSLCSTGSFCQSRQLSVRTMHMWMYFFMFVEEMSSTSSYSTILISI